MITLLLHLLRLLPFLCSGHHHLALENLALRQQLAVYKRTTNRLRLRRSDRHLWVWLSRVWPAWRQALVIVAPATVLSWQRHRFCRHRAMLSGRPPAGRPPVDAAIKALIRSMAVAALSPAATRWAIKARLWGVVRAFLCTSIRGTSLAWVVVWRQPPLQRRPRGWTFS